MANPLNRWAWKRRLVMAAGAVVLLGAVIFIAGEVSKTKDYLPYFLDRKGELVDVVDRRIEKGPGFEVRYLKLTDENGIEVEAHLKVPDSGGRLHPVIIALGGVGTGRRTIDYLGDTGGWMILALDYPYQGDRENMTHWEFLGVLPEARRALLDTVPASMLAIDYLWGRDDVDRSRVVVAGGSFGALFSPAFAAADERVTAVAIFFGAGDIQELININLEMPWPVRPVLAWLGSILGSPVEPLKYIGRIAPRPLFMLNGTEDEAMPVRISRALHDRAGEPKTVRWLPLGHVNIRSTEFHQQVLTTFTDWLTDIGYFSPDETFTVRTESPPPQS